MSRGNGGAQPAGFKSKQVQTFSIQGCPFTFESLELFRDHMKKCHPGLYREMLQKVAAARRRQLTTVPGVVPKLLESSHDGDKRLPPQELRSTSPQNQTFRCPKCPYSYTSQDYLNKHIKRFHDTLYTERLQPEEHFEDKSQTRNSAASQNIKSTPTVRNHEERDKLRSSGRQRSAEDSFPIEVKTHRLTGKKETKTYTCLLCNETFYQSDDQGFKQGNPNVPGAGGRAPLPPLRSSTPDEDPRPRTGDIPRPNPGIETGLPGDEERWNEGEGPVVSESGMGIAPPGDEVIEVEAFLSQPGMGTGQPDEMEWDDGEEETVLVFRVMNVTYISPGHDRSPSPASPMG